MSSMDVLEFFLPGRMILQLRVCIVEVGLLLFPGYSRLTPSLVCFFFCFSPTTVDVER